MDQYLDRVPGFVPDPQAAARRTDIVILSHYEEQPRTTLIDVTMAAHNAQHACGITTSEATGDGNYS